MSEYIPVIAGFTAGVAAAMGLGGGFVLMIYLTWAGMSPPEARAANLLFFIPTALMSMLINRKSGLTDSTAVPYAAAAGSIGAVIGLLLSDAAGIALMNKAFAVLLIAVGARELFHRSSREDREDLRLLRRGEGEREGNPISEAEMSFPPSRPPPATSSPHSPS